MRSKRFFLLLMAAVLVMGAVIPAHAKSSGVIRVLLTKANVTDRVDLSLDGSYTVLDALSFQRGSHVTAALRSGRIILYYEGMALDAKDKVTFVRHQVPTSQENGIRINGGYDLHPGDLTISIKDGQLRLVLSTPIEEYLLGVVPYEMSDSFPLEALKAQAVAARTYAMSKISAKGDYDVVDNTNDQVYMGIRASNQNAARAVAETNGICGYYNGKLAMCYYTASNGGQVETVKNVWGGEGDYITQHDDPYDVENPESVVRRAVIKKQITEDKDLCGLSPLLKNAVSGQLLSLGYDGKPENMMISGIVSIKPFESRFGLTSKIMNKVLFEMRMMGRRKLSQNVEEEISLSGEVQATIPPDPDALGDFEQIPVSVFAELDMFPDVETACSLSINSSNNEILTVVEQEDRFILETRRFGHGVGMSQRGAQTLAGTYKWNSEQILAFYYPKMVLKKTDTDVLLPSPIDADYLATPAPPATPTPRPTLMPALTPMEAGQYKVVVTVSQSSSLNLRAAPDMSSEVKMRLYYGQELIVLETLEGGWLHVKTDAAEGYVMEQFVTKP